jgi:hypothetical protein
MKVITSIYLNCRPELRDDWLAGTDQDSELEDALVSEIPTCLLFDWKHPDSTGLTLYSRKNTLFAHSFNSTTSATTLPSFSPR